MKNPFSKTRLAVAIASVAVCGAAFAAVSPIVLPWQGMSPKVDQHNHVLSTVGEYEGTVTIFNPSFSEPLAAACKEVISGIGDLWAISHFETTFGDMPFTGSSTLGYDTKKGKYVGTWVDSTNASMILMEGAFDVDKNAIVMDYEAFDPQSGRSKNMRSEMVQTDEGYTLTFFNMEGDTATKQMEMAMVRKTDAMEAGEAKDE